MLNWTQFSVTVHYLHFISIVWSLWYLRVVIVVCIISSFTFYSNYSWRKKIHTFLPFLFNQKLYFWLYSLWNEPFNGQLYDLTPTTLILQKWWRREVIYFKIQFSILKEYNQKLQWTVLKGQLFMWHTKYFPRKNISSIQYVL